MYQLSFIRQLSDDAQGRIRKSGDNLTLPPAIVENTDVNTFACYGRPLTNGTA